jgi:hypothetical protein
VRYSIEIFHRAGFPVSRDPGPSRRIELQRVWLYGHGSVDLTSMVLHRLNVERAKLKAGGPASPESECLVCTVKNRGEARIATPMPVEVPEDRRKPNLLLPDVPASPPRTRPPGSQAAVGRRMGSPRPIALSQLPMAGRGASAGGQDDGGLRLPA